MALLQKMTEKKRELKNYKSVKIKQKHSMQDPVIVRDCHLYKVKSISSHSL